MQIVLEDDGRGNLDNVPIPARKRSFFARQATLFSGAVPFQTFQNNLLRLALSPIRDAVAKHL